MEHNDQIALEITPQILLKAYCCGIFPMAESADDPGFHWIEPEIRGILPLDKFHIPKSLKKSMRRGKFEIRVNTTFREVMDLCAEQTNTRENTWINEPIKSLYHQLHNLGNCHSVEAWYEAKLVGGLYGVTVGAAFFGESMFSRMTDASKTCLVHLVERLRERGFVLLDTQFTTEHLERFGVVEIARDEYLGLLGDAIGRKAVFG